MSVAPSVNQPIAMIALPASSLGGDGYMAVEHHGVTRIEEVLLPGYCADIPYIRVWRGGVCRAEFPRHQLLGIYYGDPA